MSVKDFFFFGGGTPLFTRDNHKLKNRTLKYFILFFIFIFLFLLNY